MHRIGGQVDDAERGFEQETGEHAGGDDDPFGGVLAAQQVAYVELFIEQGLRAATADLVVVDAELPWEIPRQCGGEGGVGELALGAGSGREADAADDGVVALHDGREFGDRGGRDVGMFDDDAHLGELLAARGMLCVGTGCWWPHQHRDGRGAGMLADVMGERSQHAGAEFAGADDEDGGVICWLR